MARRCILAGVKKVSILYFLIMEQRWTDIPMMPGIVPSSSSTLMSKVLSLPEITELCFMFRKFDTRLCVSLLTRFMLDLRIRLEARSNSEGRCCWLGFALGGGKPLRPVRPTFEMRCWPGLMEPGENLCIVATFSARMLILRETLRSSSSSFRSVSSASSNSELFRAGASAISSSFKSSLAAAAASAARLMARYCIWSTDLRSA